MMSIVCMVKRVFNKKICFIISLVSALIYLSQLSFNRDSTEHYIHQTRSYVTLCPERLEGYHRLGNHLFMLSAVLDLAIKTRREILMPQNGWFLDNVFDFDRENRDGRYLLEIKRYTNRSSICPCKVIATPHFGYDHRFNESEYLQENMPSPNISTLQICGLSQTYLHTLTPEVEYKLRQLPALLKNNAYVEAHNTLKIFKMMMANDKLSSFALYSYSEIDNNSYIPLKPFSNTESILTDWIVLLSASDEQAFIVGVHVRMGDFLHKSEVDYGLTVANGKYFSKAFEYFIKSYKKVVFVVLSDDIDWAAEHFHEYFDKSSDGRTTDSTLFHKINFKIVFFRDTLQHDFAFLCCTDGLIISTGTFGWWAGWFNQMAPVVYYENYPKPNSVLGNKLNKSSYYIKRWIPMS